MTYLTGADLTALAGALRHLNADGALTHNTTLGNGATFLDQNGDTVGTLGWEEDQYVLTLP